VAGLSSESIKQLKITHDMDLQKQKHYINVSGERTYKKNPIFKNWEKEE
jgi:hypothetical protein